MTSYKIRFVLRTSQGLIHNCNASVVLDFFEKEENVLEKLKQHLEGYWRKTSLEKIESFERIS